MTRTEFNDLVLKISRKLYGYAYRILKDQAGAEDAVQEVFIKLWKMNSRLGEYKSIEALASTMTKNYCIDQLRKVKQFKDNNDKSVTLLHASEPTPYEQMERSETASIIGRLIEKLPDTYREMIQLRDIDGLSYEEIAIQTDQNINTLRVNLSRARKLIRDEFKRYFYEYRGNKKAAGKIL
ncbi:MAG: sigma-70 family RNA polymerase sigma factor [Bacteroidales bacterium]|nr:sigma-70 family RNA polymerase sigma factor [Bacteroidales bacterium]